MSKGKISAKPREALKAPLSPRGKASKIITDMDIERLAACVRSGEASPEQKDLFFTAIDAKAKYIAEKQGVVHADELALTLLKDYLAAGEDLHPLRNQITKQTALLKMPPQTSESKTPGLFLLWLQKHKIDLSCAFWEFANVTLLSKDRLAILDRLPRFAISDMIENAKDLLREVARRFPDFAKEAVHLIKKLEDHSSAYSSWNAREMFEGVAKLRINEDVSRGREIAKEFDELISTIILVHRLDPKLEHLVELGNAVEKLQRSEYDRGNELSVKDAINALRKQEPYKNYFLKSKKDDSLRHDLYTFGCIGSEERSQNTSARQNPKQRKKR